MLKNIKVAKLIEELQKYDQESTISEVNLSGAELISWRNDPKNPSWVRYKNRYKHDDKPCSCGYVPWDGLPF
jgi:diaminopimelate decarboxylase